MDDVTDVVFRQIVASCAPPDVFFTEFTNVEGLQSPGRAKVIQRLRLESTSTPVFAQVWGKNPENFYKTAREIADGTLVREANALSEKSAHMDAQQDRGEPRNETHEMYGDVSSGADNEVERHKHHSKLNFVEREDGAVRTFSGIDINFGCPDKNVVRNNTCSAMIKPENRQLASEIIQATLEGAGGKIPVSVKTRLGFSSIDFSWHEHVLSFPIFMLTVHGRTRKEMSKVPAQWDRIAEVVTIRDRVAPNVRIVGNGDVLSRTHGLQLAENTGVDGIMIGRGIFQDPYCFSESSPWERMERGQKIALLRQHLELFSRTWPNGEKKFEPMRKFAKVYISGFDGASELRAQLMQTHTLEEMLALL